jgi:hypothetical protein
MTVVRGEAWRGGNVGIVGSRSVRVRVSSGGVGVEQGWLA